MCFCIAIAGMTCSCCADGDIARIGEAGKCGRDCIYYVCHRFGHQVSIDEVDQQLDYQVDISFADMRKTLENRGFFASHCCSMPEILANFKSLLTNMLIIFLLLPPCRLLRKPNIIL